jgi:imidazolonepropionase-like amidohydrolase
LAGQLSSNGDYTEEVGARDGWSEEILRKNRETADIQREGFEKAVRAGVRIGFGTDAGIFPHGENARQFAYMVRHGMTPLAAIRAATIDAAASLGRSQELGSLTPGKFADLVAIDGDPLADIGRLRHVAGVIKQGQLVTAGASR